MFWILNGLKLLFPFSICFALEQLGSSHHLMQVVISVVQVSFLPDPAVICHGYSALGFEHGNTTDFRGGNTCAHCLWAPCTEAFSPSLLDPGCVMHMPFQSYL